MECQKSNFGASKIVSFTFLLPALQLVLQFWQLAAVEYWFLDASALLLAIVVEQAESITAQ